MSSTDLFISVTEILLTTAVLAFLLFYIQTRRRYQYWKKLGVRQFEPVFPVGNLSTSVLGVKSVYVRLQELHNAFKKENQRFGGIYFFNGPVFMVVSTDLVKRVLLTDFEYFSDRGLYIDEEKLPITAHISSMKGEQWRNIRTKFTPVFTSGKLKVMHQSILNNILNMLDMMKGYEDGRQVDIKQVFVNLTTDIVGTVAFGIECNCLRYPNEEFAVMVKKIFNASTWDLFKLCVNEGLQNPGNIMKTAYCSKDVIKFFTDLVHKNVDYRDKNNIVRDDFMNLLLKLRDTVGMSLDEMVAQSFLFFIAGFETTSSTMSACMHELVYNVELQEQVRQEIIKNIGTDVSKFTYEGVMTLPLLDRVFKETLRKHPPIGMMTRMVVKPYKIPDTDIVLPPGTPLLMSILGLHRDPEFFPDPMKFDPDRFSPENVRNIVPYSYLSFGEGPRNCIGMRLALVAMKLSIAALVSNFKWVPGEGSQRELPINPRTTAIVLTVKGGVPVKLIKI